jgi:hypothetical protein
MKKLIRIHMIALLSEMTKQNEDFYMNLKSTDLEELFLEELKELTNTEEEITAW